MFDLSLSLVAKAPQTSRSVFISTPSFERLAVELSKGGEIKVPGLQKTRRSTCKLCVLFFQSCSCGHKSVFLLCSFDDFLVIFLLKQHVACLKTTAPFHSHVQIYAVCMRTRHPHFPFLLFGYGRSYLSTVRADSLNNQ